MDTTQIRIIKEITRLEMKASEYALKAQDFRLLFQKQNEMDYDAFREEQIKIELEAKEASLS